MCVHDPTRSVRLRDPPGDPLPARCRHHLLPQCHCQNPPPTVVMPYVVCKRRRARAAVAVWLMGGSRAASHHHHRGLRCRQCMSDLGIQWFRFTRANAYNPPRANINMYIIICEYNVADYLCRSYRSHPVNMYVQITQIIQIPPGETCM